MRVLVVEDERALADAIARGLRREGMAVDVAYDGDTGHEKSTITRYDVVVLDRDLPGMPGDRLCAEIVGSGSTTRVLMLTASGTLADRVDGLSLGADDYLAKPFAFPELVARCRALGRRATPAAPPVLRGGRPRAGPGPADRHPRGAAGRADPQGVRRARGAAGRRGSGGVQRGAAGAGLGRERRPVHHHGAGDGDDPAPQARRARCDRDGGRRRLPRAPRPAERPRPARVGVVVPVRDPAVARRRARIAPWPHRGRPTMPRPTRAVRRWRTAGLRPRLTLLSTALVALVSALLLWLGWLLVGGW